MVSIRCDKFSIGPALSSGGKVGDIKTRSRTHVNPFFVTKQVYIFSRRSRWRIWFWQTAYCLLQTFMFARGGGLGMGPLARPDRLIAQQRNVGGRNCGRGRRTDIAAGALYDQALLGN